MLSVDGFGGAAGVGRIFATKFAMDAAQYPVDKTNMKRVTPNINMLDLDLSPCLLEKP